MAAMLNSSSGEYADVSSHGSNADSSLDVKKPQRRCQQKKPVQLPEIKTKSDGKWISFKLTEHGGTVKLSFGELEFPRGSVQKEISLSVTAVNIQKKRRNEENIVFLSPAVHFKPCNKEPCELSKPANVSIIPFATYQRKGVHPPIKIEIHQTKSTANIDWKRMKKSTYGYHKYVSFSSNILCGFRVVSFSKSVIPVTLQYAVVIKRPTAIQDPKQHIVLVWIVNNRCKIPENVEKILDEQTMTLSSGSQLSVKMEVVGNDIVETSEEVHTITVPTADQEMRRSFPFHLKKTDSDAAMACDDIVQVDCHLNNRKNPVLFHWAKESEVKHAQAINDVNINVEGPGSGITNNTLNFNISKDTEPDNLLCLRDMLCNRRASTSYPQIGAKNQEIASLEKQSKLAISPNMAGGGQCESASDNQIRLTPVKEESEILEPLSITSDDFCTMDLSDKSLRSVSENCNDEENKKSSLNMSSDVACAQGTAGAMPMTSTPLRAGSAPERWKDDAAEEISHLSFDSLQEVAGHTTSGFAKEDDAKIKALNPANSFDSGFETNEVGESGSCMVIHSTVDDIKNVNIFEAVCQCDPIPQEAGMVSQKGHGCSACSSPTQRYKELKFKQAMQRSLQEKMSQDCTNHLMPPQSSNKRCRIRTYSDTHYPVRDLKEVLPSSTPNHTKNYVLPSPLKGKALVQGSVSCS